MAAPYTYKIDDFSHRAMMKIPPVIQRHFKVSILLIGFF